MSGSHFAVRWCLVACVVLTVGVSTTAAWVTNGKNVGPDIYADTVGEVRTLPDGAGGLWLVWSGNRFGTYDIFVQRINSSGNRTISGIGGGLLICNAARDQVRPRLASDGAGGIVVTWEDYRNSTLYTDIYATRLGSNGFPVSGWPVNGIAVAGGAVRPEIVGDAAGGAIVFYHDLFAETRAKRIASTGIVWERSYGTAHFADSPVQVVSDGVGGAVFTFGEYSGEIHVQRVNTSGTSLWSQGSLGGDPILPESGLHVRLAYAGGVYVAYTTITGSEVDVHIYYFDPTGANSGLLFASGTGAQDFAQIVPGPYGDAFAAYYEGDDLYAIRVSASGPTCAGLTPTPVRVTTDTGVHTDLSLAPDGVGGAVLAWAKAGDVFARRVQPNLTLDPQQTLSNAIHNQITPVAALTSSGIVVSAWPDARDSSPGITTRIYAQQTIFVPLPEELPDEVCGNGIDDDCDGDGDSECCVTVDLPAYQCEMCENSSYSVCGPGIKQLCCP